MGNQMSSICEMDLGTDNDTELMDEIHLNETVGATPDADITTYVITSVFVAIFVIGVCGNVMLIYTVCRNLSMQSPQNIYLATMSFADLLICLISVPFAGVIYITSTWPFGLVLCKFNAMLQDISIGVSIFTLLILSVDRYTAIVTPFKLHNKRSSRGCSSRLLLKVMVIWWVSIALSLPDAINTIVQEMPKPDNGTYQACLPYPPHLGSYNITLVLGKFFVYFVIPVSFITVVYGMMARQLLSSTTEFMPSTGQSNPQQLQKQMKGRKSLAKLFLVMVLLFVLCFLPKHIFLMWFYGNPDSMANYNICWHIFKSTSHCLAYVNSCINPLTLYFLSKVFRRYFNRYMCGLCRSQNEKLEDNEQSEWLRRGSAPSLPETNGILDRRRSNNSSIRFSVKTSSTLTPVCQ